MGNTISIYVANLAAYNNGKMIGGWLTPSHYQDFEAFEKEIKKVTKFADEVAVHDYENLPSSFGEYPDMEELYDFCNLVAHYENEISLQAIIGYADNFGGNLNTDLIEQCKDRYYGCYGSFQEYAEEWADSVGDYDSIPEHLRAYFDLESYARDLSFDFTVVDAPNCNVFVFANQ